MQIHSPLVNLNSLQALAPPSPARNSVNTRAVRDAVSIINESELLGFDRELRFSTDPLSKLAVLQVLERTTGNVILQIPSELILELAQSLQNNN